MKNIFTTLLLAITSCMAINLSAQDISEGLIKMEISDVSSEDQQIAAQLEMMKGTETNYYFNADQSLTTANMMGGMITMKNLFMNDSEAMTILFDVMGQKMMVESSKEDRKEAEAEQKEAMEDFEIVYDKEDTKEILGYKCYKATIKGGEEMLMTFEMYISPDVKASSKMIQGLQAFEIDGFPLEYVMDMGKMSMTYSTTELLDKVDANIFNVNTDGYKKMTFEEFQEQMQGMGGGLGF